MKAHPRVALAVGGSLVLPDLGDSSDVATSLTGSVNGPYMAQLLSQRLGYRHQVFG